jgi:hypothetical protein
MCIYAILDVHRFVRTSPVWTFTYSYGVDIVWGPSFKNVDWFFWKSVWKISFLVPQPCSRTNFELFDSNNVYSRFNKFRELINFIFDLVKRFVSKKGGFWHLLEHVSSTPKAQKKYNLVRRALRGPNSENLQHELDVSSFCSLLCSESAASDFRKVIVVSVDLDRYFLWALKISLKFRRTSTSVPLTKLSHLEDFCFSGVPCALSEKGAPCAIYLFCFSPKKNLKKM